MTEVLSYMTLASFVHIYELPFSSSLSLLYLDHRLERWCSLIEVLFALMSLTK